jgi:hypothetical protein
MAAEDERRTSPERAGNAAGEQPLRRSFTRPGRTKVDRNRDLPVDRQIRALLKNPTPSPAEQNRLCELTRTKSYRAAVGVAKRMLAASAPPPKPAVEHEAPKAKRPRRSN